MQGDARPPRPQRRRLSSPGHPKLEGALASLRCPRNGSGAILTHQEFGSKLSATRVNIKHDRQAVRAARSWRKCEPPHIVYFDPPCRTCRYGNGRSRHGGAVYDDLEVKPDRFLAIHHGHGARQKHPSKNRRLTFIGTLLSPKTERPITIVGRSNVGVQCSRHAHPSCLRLMPSFQIFVMWRILSPSNCIT